MQYEIEVNGQLRQVVVTRRGSRFVVVMGDREWTVDAAQVGSHTLSLLIEGQAASNGNSAAAPYADGVMSREISIASDPVTGQFVFGVGTVPLSVGLNTRRRFGRTPDAAPGGAGPQRLVAPMPGKIVRILGKAGDAVAHRQPLVVIEAMKMENELRATRDGILTELLVQEGQSVEAGTLLAIITPS